MSNNPKFPHDRFTFSLRGMRTVGSFIAMPIIADDRVRQRREAPDSGSRSWLRNKPQT